MGLFGTIQLVTRLVSERIIFGVRLKHPSSANHARIAHEPDLYGNSRAKSQSNQLKP